MTKKPTAALLALALVLGHAQIGPAAAQSASDEGDLSAAVITLDGVVRQLAASKGSEAALSLAHLYLSIAHLGLSQFERAKSEMREAWIKNRGLNLDPKKFPPRVIQTFEEAKTPDGAAEMSAAPAEPAKGSSKALLILGGVAAIGGGVALAGGGNSTAGPTAPAPTPRPTPQILASGSGTFTGQGFCSFGNITLASAGVIQYTANWTLSTSTFRLTIGQGACPGFCGPAVASVGPSA